MTEYRLIVCVYDHKLGPTCVNPKKNCEWLAFWRNSRNLIQDGLNTKSDLLTILLNDKLVQILKFSIHDERLRGKTLRCALFCFVPYEIYLLPKTILEEIIDGYKSIAFKNDNDVGCQDCNYYLEGWEKDLNSRLFGSIGRGKITNKIINQIGAIKGFTEILLSNELGSLNPKQKECLDNILDAIKNLTNIIKKQKEILI
ncbi:MAG: hypothetical protein ACTSRZ_13770 [Promethearchaeota archaeon]